MNFRGTVIIKKEEWFVATCLENNIASQGKTIDEATENLKEAIALYYENETQEKIVTRKNKKNVILISVDEYNSLIETNYLLSNEANAEHLKKSIAQHKLCLSHNPIKNSM